MNPPPSRWVARGLAALTLINGLLALFRPLAERFPDRVESLLVLANYQSLTRSLDVFLGVCLIYLSYQLLHRRLLAWWLALVTSLALAGLHLAASHLIITAAVPLAATASLLATKRYFQARSEPSDIRTGAVILAASLTLMLVYGATGFWFMHMRDFGINFSLGQSLTYTLRSYLLLGTNLVPHSRHARWFLDSLSLIGAITLTFGLYSLFRPLEYSLLSLPRQRATLELLLQRHSHSSEDFFKLWPHDKSYFFTGNQDAALAYGVVNGVAMVVQDPVGSEAGVASIIGQFNAYCLTQGWLPAYVYASVRYLPQYRAQGLTALKIGEDAVVDIEKFRHTTGRNKHFRNIANRFAKQGFTASYHQPPHSHQLLAEVSRISAAWLGQPGRKEWQFFAGTYSDHYMQSCRLVVIRDAGGRALAFANIIPAYQSEIATIDLMRYHPDAPPNLMDWLFYRLLMDLDGPKQFNLGLAPLSGLAEGATRPEERLLDLVYRSRQGSISFQGLRQFKSKFEPDWEPKYIAYRGSAGKMPIVAYALQKIMS